MSEHPRQGGHTPVLIAEIVDALRPKDGGIYVDGTFGAGGYAPAILNAAACRVWAISTVALWTTTLSWSTSYVFSAMTIGLGVLAAAAARERRVLGAWSSK